VCEKNLTSLLYSKSFYSHAFKFLYSEKMKVKWRNIILLAVGLFVLLMLITIVMTPMTGCKQIDDCKACWSWVPVPRECGNETCETDPAIEQHNALVDVIICACEKARANNYGNKEMNKEIEMLFKEVTASYTGSAREICEGSLGASLIKWRYE